MNDSESPYGWFMEIMYDHLIPYGDHIDGNPHMIWMIMNDYEWLWMIMIDLPSGYG